MRALLTWTLCLAISLPSLFAQNENNHWFFGQNCGLTFTPTVTNIPGSLNTNEGCASISDNAGNLLFYTDGITVYNRNGVGMTNGTGLMGNPSATSSAIIVPRPCSDTEYYVFTADFVSGTNGTTYNVVDMDDNGDCFVSPSETGQVLLTAKNISLPGPNGERLCATKKSNGLDYWVIATEKSTNRFYVYEVTALGLNTTPIVQAVGVPTFAGYYMKVSPDGTKIGLADGSGQKVYLYDFNTSSGVISNPQFVGNTPVRPYGIAFSPNSQKMYYSDFAFSNGTGTGIIYEVDIFPTLGTPTQIGNIPNNGLRFACGAMQLSPENPQRILIAKDGENMLAAINNPDVGGAANFVANAVPLTNTCGLGLPTFVSGNIRRCKPLDMLNYQLAVPTLFLPAIKAELSTDGFTGLDKEYEDIDNDGDIDLIFTKANVLHYVENGGGYCNVPIFPNSSVTLGISSCYSFRAYDWDADGDNDLIVHGTVAGTNGIYLHLNNGVGTFAAPTMLLDGTVGTGDFPFSTQQLIAVGDLNSDNLPDILIGDQNAIQGIMYFENSLTAGLSAVGGQTPAAPFLAEYGGSFPCPELYDADCINGEDLLVFDPLTGPNDPLTPTSTFAGGRMVYYENTGVASSGVLPNLASWQVNQFGFDDVTNDDLRCDWVITRIVDFFNDGCPIAISYNPCSGEFYFYFQQNCSCSSQNFVAVEEVLDRDVAITVFPNPTQGEFRILNEANLKIERVSVLSVDGKIVQSTVYTNEPITVSELSDGLYFVIIHTSAGTISRKMLVLR